MTSLPPASSASESAPESASESAPESGSKSAPESFPEATPSAGASVVVREVPGFLPSTAGFHFANRWPHVPPLAWRLAFGGPVPATVGLALGDAAFGLCGGMALSVADLWAAGVQPPPDREPPPAGSPAFRRIVARQIDSFEWGRSIAAFYRLAVATEATRGRHAVANAWPSIRADIESGRPAVVGLLHVASADPRRLSANHQVLAWAYRLDRAAGSVALSIYDPNHPDADDIRLTIRLTADRRGAALDYAPGDRPVIGILRQGWTPRDAAPWRAPA